MKINLDAPSEDVRIEVIPLIDIIFCILTFFIVVALQVTRQQAINVDLPAAKNGAASQMRENLIVTLLEQDRIYVEQQQVNSPEQFTQALKNYHATNPKGAIVLRASRAVSYDLVIQVLDLMKRVGGDRVALATDSVSASGQAPGSDSMTSPALGAPNSTPFQPYNPYGTASPPVTMPYSPNQPLPVVPGQSSAQPNVYPISPGSTVPPPTPIAPKQGGSAPKR